MRFILLLILLLLVIGALPSWPYRWLVVLPEWSGHRYTDRFADYSASLAPARSINCRDEQTQRSIFVRLTPCGATVSMRESVFASLIPAGSSLFPEEPG